MTARSNWPDERFLRKARWPRRHEDLSDFSSAVERFVLPGYIPDAPPFSRRDKVFAQGSCFAAEIQKALNRAGTPSDYVEVGEEINSPLANRLMFEYALTDAPVRCDHHARALQPELRQLVKRCVQTADVLVLTLGLGFEPYLNGELTFSIVPEFLNGVEWRLSTVEKNAEHIEAIMASALNENPNLRFVISVSPIPLKNSFLHYSPFAADCVSKSTLRLAAEAIMSKRYDGVYYWPSFEAVRWLAPHHGRIFGIGDGVDHRHIEREKIDVITSLFLKYFFAA